MAADPSKLSYFSLPGEAPNKIMDLVLVHGDVFPRGSVSKTSSDTKANVASPPGIQLLATCKQAHNEGHELFYSSNTFHLPPTMTFEWSNELQAKHKAMVKRISITLGLEELTVNTLDKTRAQVRACASDFVVDTNFLSAPLFQGLFDVWKSKMEYIAAWRSLEEIKLCSFNRTNVIQRRDVVTNLWDLHHRWKRSRYWHSVLDWPKSCVRGNIHDQAYRVGWERAIEWLHVRKPGEMAKDFRLSHHYAGPGWLED